MVFVKTLYRSYRLDVRDDNLLQVLVHGLSITPMRGRLRNVPVLREGIVRMAAFSSSRVYDLRRQQTAIYCACKQHGNAPLIILAFAVDLPGATRCHSVAAARGLAE